MVARLLRNRNKPVSPACYCFDVTGSGGRVSQGPAKSMYALVEAALERRHECVFEEKTLEEKAEKEQRQRRQTRMQELIKMSEEQQARLMNDQPITGEAESDEANKLG